MGRKLASKSIFGLFVLFLMVTLFIIGYSIINYTDPDYNVETYVTDEGTTVTVSHGDSLPVPVLLFCNSTFILLTILWFYDWRRRKRHDKLIDDLPSYVRMLRRAKLETLAQRMNISTKEVDSILQTCVKKGTVKGYFDYSTGEFVLEGTQYHGDLKERPCPNCGAMLKNTFLEGEEIRCDYCNMVMIQK